MYPVPICPTATSPRQRSQLSSPGLILANPLILNLQALARSQAAQALLPRGEIHIVTRQRRRRTLPPLLPAIVPENESSIIPRLNTDCSSTVALRERYCH